jgi:outer membrane protein assembly factor BamA
VRAGRVTYANDKEINVEIVVEEGEPVRVARVDVHGLEQVDAELGETAQDEARSLLPVNERFEEQPFEDAAAAIERAFADNGHAFVKVRRAADVNAGKNRASVGFWVDPYWLTEIGGFGEEIAPTQVRYWMRIPGFSG